ncbi:MAG: apolipoprotein D and lipocalin family protein [Cellvibrionaceae bacterium]|jgi:apolipoprotein D and lipocalin family protein
MRVALLLLMSTWLVGCLGMPEKISPVDEFELKKYLGKWYEIARLDHSFERGLESVTAEYSLRKEDGFSVVNRGYSPEDGEWRVAEGKAYFVNKEDEGYLKVSFFGPFYGSYVIFELDKVNYEYAFVSGPDTSYLWLLSRSPNLPQEIIDKFKQRSKASGFDISHLIFVNQD